MVWYPEYKRVGVDPTNLGYQASFYIICFTDNILLTRFFDFSDV